MGILDALKGGTNSTDDQADAETERLLAEIEQQGKTEEQDRVDLEARAKELRVKFRPNISDEKLRERVAKAEAKQAGSTDNESDADITDDRVLTNIGKNPYGLTAEVVITAGDEYHLTDEDLTDEKLMGKVERAIESGALVRGHVNNKDVICEENKQHGDRLLVNVGRNPHRVGGTTIGVGDTYVLTDMNLADDMLMTKVNRAVELGILTRGAD